MTSKLGRSNFLAVSIFSTIAVTSQLLLGIPGNAQSQIAQETPMPIPSPINSPQLEPIPTSTSDIYSFVTTLTGAAEVPRGDRDGRGYAWVTILRQENKLCYKVAFSGLGTVTAAHIQQGRAGVNGPVVLPLNKPSRGPANKCLFVKPELLQSIINQPSNFYVNVRTRGYPNGAIRGQLVNKITPAAVTNPL
ncbi:MAG: CHRD domain-containing protein [Aphanothece sp. CMT-3BRIN-NPC111]|jgi:hypothetical protein|nr:CHRD domain-containing protein [Aphanothece sp. CMT-3BRIN-NPC111]